MPQCCISTHLLHLLLLSQARKARVVHSSLVILSKMATARFPLLLACVMLTCIAALALQATASRPDPPPPGLFWTRVKNASKMRIYRILGNYAVDVYNEWHHTCVKFEKVVEGQEEHLLGGISNWRMMIRVKDGSFTRYFWCMAHTNDNFDNVNLSIINPTLP